MLCLAADENSNNDIVRGLLRRKPELDIIRVQDAAFPATPIRSYWSGVQTMVACCSHMMSGQSPKHAFARASAGKPMPGVFEVSRDIPVSVAIEDILLIAECSLDGEWQGQVRYLPLR